MANRMRGEVEVDLGGKKYTLRPSFEGILEMEDRAGVPLMTVLKMASEKALSFKVATGVVYGGLIGAGERNLSFEQVGALIVKGGLPSYFTPIARLISSAILPPSDEPIKEEEAKKEPKAGS